MFKKLLLPVDLADRHRQAMAVAVSLARQNAAELLLLHVIEIIPGLAVEEDKNFYARLEKKARQHLKELGKRLERDKVPARAEIRFGNRGAEIVAFANQSGTDLIVLTAPKIDLRKPAAGWGSLSFKVSALAPCPVLLVK